MAKTKTKLIDNNKFIFVISLIIAFVLWVTVSPSRESSVNCSIQIDTNTSSAGELGLEVIKGKKQDVKVSVQGKWYTISELTQDDITISYSFAGIINAGEYEIQLTATKKNATDDFVISGITPDKVTVGIDYIKTNDYTVNVIADNISAAKGSVVGTPIIDTEESTISITGPETALSKLNKVVAEIDDEETLSESTAFETDLKFLDKKGNEIDTSQLTIPTKKVNVTIPINIYKTVPINVVFDSLPSGISKGSVSYTISPSTIQLLGTAEAMAKIDSITLDPISFNTITPKKSAFNVKLALPSGVASVNGIDTVTVKIDMTDYSSKSFEISKFKAKGSIEGKSAVVKTSYKSVTIVGPKTVIDGLANSDLYLEYDLSSVKSKVGTVSVDAFVYSTKSNKIWIAGNCEVQIEIEDE